MVCAWSDRDPNWPFKVGAQHSTALRHQGSDRRSLSAPTCRCRRPPAHGCHMGVMPVASCRISHCDVSATCHEQNRSLFNLIFSLINISMIAWYCMILHDDSCGKRIWGQYMCCLCMFFIFTGPQPGGWSLPLFFQQNKWSGTSKLVLRRRSS